MGSSEDPNYMTLEEAILGGHIQKGVQASCGESVVDTSDISGGKGYEVIDLSLATLGFESSCFNLALGCVVKREVYNTADPPALLGTELITYVQDGTNNNNNNNNEDWETDSKSGTNGDSKAENLLSQFGHQYLYDDHTDSNGETDEDKWTVRDNHASRSSVWYICDQVF
tara:strand:- start:156 stop:665 length:510 start_codon:yes stop_codon:yes gene_type:complete